MRHFTNLSAALILASILFFNSCKKTETPVVPVACFTPSATAVAQNTAISFTNCTTTGSSYSWNFGDGTTSIDASPTHTYTSSGTYTVTLTVTNADGTNTKTSYITVTGGGGGCVKTVIEIDNTPISSPTTWDSCHIYHVTNSVSFTSILTIEAGTIVKFDDLKGLNVNSGQLIVNGTDEAPVIFTSAKDDSYGGDINGDGSATSPQKGDWSWINMGNSSGNKLDYCKIFYAGSGSTGYEVAVNMGTGENNTIRHSVIAHTAGDVYQSRAALSMSWCPQSCVAQYNVLYDNGHPMSIGISNDIDDTNIFHNPDNPSETNAANGIFVDIVYSQDQAQIMTWSATEVPFVLGGWSGNGWTFDSGKTLVLGDNVVLKFHTHNPTPGFYVLIPSGAGQIQNYDGSGVIFTSYEDDSVLGDTNGDGFSTGTSGSWDGIYTTGLSYFNWGNIYYAAH